MPRKKVFYPSNKKAVKRGGPTGPEVEPERPNLARINLAAAAGQAGFAVGDRVKIAANGTYSGEIGTIERMVGGVIPSALVRVAGGGSRQVRTIDLVPAPVAEQQQESSAAE